MSSEDRGMQAVSLIFVNMPEHFWPLLGSVGVILVVGFLSRVNLDTRSEDMTVFQALPIAILWSSLGIGLILFNKFIFLPAGSGFNFPFTIFLMWFHALSGTFSTNLIRAARPCLMPAVRDSTLGWKSYFVNILPIAALQACSLAFGNTAYLHISVAYIQMVKNTTSAFVFVFSIMLALEKGTCSNTFAVMLVVVGLLLTTVGELDFSLFGFILQMCATLSDSLRLALTKIVLSSNHAVRLDPMSALYFSSPTMLMILTVPMLLIDSHRMTVGKVWEMKYVLAANALIAFGLNVTSMFFIKRCGATTYALTGVLKDVALILLCCAMFGHPMTSMQMGGFVVSLIGFQLYNNLKTDPDLLLKITCSLRGVEYVESKTESSPLYDTKADSEIGPSSRINKLPRTENPKGAASVLYHLEKGVGP